MTDATPLSKDHYLDLNNGEFDRTSKVDLDHLFQKLADDKAEKLVVHFHGGNVSRDEGMAIAGRLADAYRDAGAYPVFFVWNSSIAEILSDTREKLFRPLTQQLAGIFSWSALRSFFASQPRGLLYRAAFASYRAMCALYRIARRFLSGRSHGIRATIVEELLRAFFVAEFGFAVWYTMKREIVDAFKDDANTCGGTAFLLGLQGLLEKKPGLRIILVAHSGGAIYACHFLENAAKHIPDAKFDVIFLAAAVTCELFDETFRKHRDRIRRFRSFALQDSVECGDRLFEVRSFKDRLLNFIYPRSLLYFMSGVCEHEDRDRRDIGDVPLLGMQRYYEKPRVYRDRDIETLRAFMRDPQSGVWSIANGGPGLGCSTAKHIGFDEDQVTVASLKHIIRNDFIAAPPETAAGRPG